ncbi:MAG: Uma2 family endonuclease [Polyangiaceae bacterium]
MSAPKFPFPLGDDPPPPQRTPLGEVVLGHPATKADLDKLPRTWRGEILNGTMYAFPRPRGKHQLAGGTLYGDIERSFHRGRGGPGGWLIVIEPGIELPMAKEVSPDIAGWRRERMSQIPAKGPIRVAPDWVCEVLSPRTSAYDQTIKRRFYANVGVSYLWYIDPRSRLLTALRLNHGTWEEVGVWAGDAAARIEPFEALEISLADLWADVEPVQEEDDDSPSPPSSVVG